MQYFPGASMHTKSLKVNTNCIDGLCLVFLDRIRRGACLALLAWCTQTIP